MSAAQFKPRNVHDQRDESAEIRTFEYREGTLKECVVAEPEPMLRQTGETATE